MIKRFFTYGMLAVVLILFISTAVFLFNKSQEPPVVHETVHPIITTIERKTIATGKIVPRKEVNITSQVSGVVEEVHVEEGQKVQQGDLIAKIALIPDMVMLNNAESQLNAAQLSFDNATHDLERQKSLYQKGFISESDYRNFMLDYNLKRQSLAAASDNFMLIKEGATAESEKVSNLIHATVDGMVLDIPNEEGSFIVEASTFGAGTTVATLADMEDMVFEGMVDESEVGKLREGMELLLDVGALRDESFTAILEHIAPKGVEENGAVKFLIRAAIQLPDESFLRANYSANAEIILARRQDVLAINERDLLIEGDNHFVEVETAPQVFEKRKIETGLSDGIHIEVVSGLSKEESIKRQSAR